MKYYTLSDEEQKEVNEIEQALERGELKSVPDLEKAKKEAARIARNTLNKTRNINIRLTERDLHLLKRKAAEEGIPYQTLAASTIHKAVSK